MEPSFEEDVDSPLDRIPDQDSGLDEVVATPTNGASWTTDGEITPMFSSNFLSTPDSSALRCEGHPDPESLRTSTSRSTKLRAAMVDTYWP